MRTALCQPLLLLLRRRCGQSLLAAGYSTPAPVRLEHVGSLTSPKVSERYAAGQLFVHRLFGYRGVVLAGYEARLFDKSEAASPGAPAVIGGRSRQEPQPQQQEQQQQQPEEEEEEGEQQRQQQPEAKQQPADSSPCLWYLVLVDQRDANPSLREGFTFLPNRPDPTVTLMSAVDYCSHGELLPYDACQQPPSMDNPWFADFFLSGASQQQQQQLYGPTKLLQNWTEKMHRLLRVDCVYRETTEQARVTVLPFYMGCRGGGDAGVHYWRYTVRIENLDAANRPIVLRERYWKIFSAGGTIETLKGRGVVGAEPELNSRYPLFQYHSHVQLRAPWGYMWGCYNVERLMPQLPAEGAVQIPSERLQFEVKIPVFSLSQKPAPASTSAAGDSGGGAEN